MGESWGHGRSEWLPEKWGTMAIEAYEVIFSLQGCRGLPQKLRNWKAVNKRNFSTSEEAMGKSLGEKWGGGCLVVLENVEN